jgi:hypothetical protein
MCVSRDTGSGLDGNGATVFLDGGTTFGYTQACPTQYWPGSRKPALRPFHQAEAL